MKRMLCALLALGLLACSRGDDIKVAEPPVVQHHAAQEAEFNFTADQFVQAFNNASKAASQSYRLNRLDVQHGAVHDYVRHTFSSGIELTAAVSKETGHIMNVTALVSGDSTITSRHSLMAISEVVAVATNPDMSTRNASKMVDDMLREATHEQVAGQFPQRFINHVRYVLRSGSGIGTWMIATPAA